MDGLNPTTMGQPRNRKQLSPEEWDELKPLIVRLYIKENKTLEQVAQILCQEKGFLLSKHQFTRKLDQWKIHKNARRHDRHRARKISTFSNENPATRENNISSNDMTESWKLPESAELNCSSVFGPGSIQHITDNHIPYISSSPYPQTKNNTLDLNDIEVVPREDKVLSWIPYNANHQTELRDSADVDGGGGFGLVELFELLEIETRGSLAVREIIETLGQAVIDNDSTEYVEPTTLVAYGSPDALTANHLVKNRYGNGRNSVKSIPMTPLKRNQHADFPPATAMYLKPSPFNELYPFVSFPSNNKGPRRINQIPKVYDDEFVQEQLHLKTLSEACHSAESFIKQGKFGMAESLCRQIIDCPRNSNKPKQLHLELNLLDSIIAQGRPEEAFRLHNKLHCRIINNHPTESELVRRSLIDRIRLFEQLDDDEAVEKTCREHVQITLGHFGPRDLRTLDAIFYLASSKAKQKNHEESIRLYSMTIQLQYELRCSSRDMNRIMSFLARLLHDRGQTREAIELFHKLRREMMIPSGEEDQDPLELYRGFGQVLRKSKLYDESQQILRKGVGLYIKMFGEKALPTVEAMHDLGVTLRECGQYKEAIDWLKKSLTGYLDLGMVNGYSLDSFWVLRESCTELGLFEDLQIVSTIVDQHLRGEWEKKIDALRGKQLSVALDWMYELGVSFEECGRTQEASYWIEKVILDDPNWGESH